MKANVAASTLSLAWIALGASPALGQSELQPRDPVSLAPDAGTASGTCQSRSLTTLIAANQIGASDWMHFFDLQIDNPAGILVEAMDVNLNTTGTTAEIDVYVIPGTSSGNEQNPGAWTLVSTGSGTSMGTNNPTFIDLADFSLTSGSWGVGVHYRIGAGPSYTVGNGSNEFYPNCDMDLTATCVLSGLFSGVLFCPRVWNGTLYYCADVSAGRTYCTAKTNSCGTLPAIGVSGTPSATAASGHVVTGANANNNKIGLLVYSESGRAAIPFQGGTLCMNPPIRRTTSVNSGGSSGCDGQFSIDMNAFARGNLGGNPAAFLSVPGTQVDVQWWGRDTAANGSYLSDAAEYCIGS